jgi:hypothetical protein
MEHIIKVFLGFLGVILLPFITIFIMILGFCLCILSPFIALSFLIGILKADDFYSIKLWTPWNKHDIL